MHALPHASTHADSHYHHTTDANTSNTQIKVSKLEQIGAFGKPFRDPRGHMVSVAFTATVEENTIAIAADDAKEAVWFSCNVLPNLAFDHLEIINTTLSKKKQVPL